MAAQFVLRRSQAPGGASVFTFQLLDNAGHLLLTNEGYRDRRGVVHGMDSVRRLVPDAEVERGPR